MKRVVLVLILFAILATGTVFADHPSGFGIGVQGGTTGFWDTSYYGKDLRNGGALSLKIPKVPVFWAVRLDSWAGELFLGLSGDYYLIDKVLAKDIHLNWYLGLGLGVATWISEPANYFAIAGRVPIGLSFQPIPLLEIFLQVVPQMGASIKPEIHIPYGGWGIDLGLRVWF